VGGKGQRLNAAQEAGGSAQFKQSQSKPSPRVGVQGKNGKRLHYDAVAALGRWGVRVFAFANGAPYGWYLGGGEA
jgi:hypothetical protein